MEKMTAWFPVSERERIFECYFVVLDVTADNGALARISRCAKKRKMFFIVQEEKKKGKINDEGNKNDNECRKIKFGQNEPNELCKINNFLMSSKQ